MTLAFLALLGAPYIYDISSLRVKYYYNLVTIWNESSLGLVVWRPVVSEDLN